jgi:hypothetical protein
VHQAVGLVGSRLCHTPLSFSSLLISDFEVTVLVVHQTRALAMAIIKASSTSGSIHASISSKSQQTSKEIPAGTNSVDIREEAVSIVIEPIWSLEPVRATQNNKYELMAINGGDKDSTTSTDTEMPLNTNFKGAVVNDRAQKQRKSTQKYKYNLPSDYKARFPQIASKLNAFNKIMIQPSSYLQDAPIQPASADVCMQHARQFLACYVTTH